MKLDIRKVAVLGAGTMGAQVAAHLVAQGLEVTLLDLTATAGTARSALAERGREALRKLKPSPLHLSEDLAAIAVGNFDDDLKAAVAQADWVFEAVVEDLAVKRDLFARCGGHLKGTAIVTTNTSGIPLRSMAEALGAVAQKRFFGTHFFNPPRYLKLLETIPGPQTDPQLLAAFEGFAATRLGKAVVRCKDTPNFIANRIGSYAVGAVFQAMIDLDLDVADVDLLTGPAIGRARSATFRTADIAGIDVLSKVAGHLYEAVPEDPERVVFKLPPFLQTMLERKWLGEKSGSGFYKKQGKEILALDWRTLEYKPRERRKFASLEATAHLTDASERLARIVAGTDKGAQFLWRVLVSSGFYAASLVPEIAEDEESIDRAMEWGYAWGLGPFRTLDALGLPAVVERARAEGRKVPERIARLLASGRTRFHDGPRAPRDRCIDLGALKAASPAVVRRRNAGASLVDIGDGCGLVEFHSKMNALGADTFAMLNAAVKEGREHFDAIVIGNQGEQFTVGANLQLVLMGAQQGDWDELDFAIRQFQRANMGLKYAQLPVVAAPFGRTFGGGCEIALHAARVQASAETYMGLVEAGVGLIPGGGGTKEMTLRAFARCASVEDADPSPFLRRAFDTIAFARVATSGAEARQLFLTPADSISANPDHLIHDAKQLALGLARSGWHPQRPRTDIPALGRPMLAMFKAGIHNARRAAQISAHDAAIALKLATIMCGGERAPGTISEEGLLDLEREAFLSLLGTPETRARIQFMLDTNQPLRN